MKSSEELKLKYKNLRQEIFDEMRFTLQFCLSHHYLLQNKVDDLPPQFNQLRMQMIQSFWAMIHLRLLLFFDDSSSCSLWRFVCLSYELKLISLDEKNTLTKKMEELQISDQILKSKAARDRIIAHSDKKKPQSTKMNLNSTIESIEKIFVAAGGNKLDKNDLEIKLGNAWGSMFDLLRLGMSMLPQKYK